jgi:uncharacterized SAM-binding protein YcdF (DUF218 family)
VIDVIWVKAVLKALILPPTGPLLVSLVGLALLARRPRLGRAIAALGVGLLLALSVPVVAFMLNSWVDDTPPIDIEQAKSAQALVILGGGIRRNALEYGGDTLGRLTLDRVRYGARVARMTNLPVMVTGGSVYGGETEAKLMRDALESEFGVPVRWSESRSRTTKENALFSAEILRRADIHRVVVVAHSVDMPRVRAEFARNSIDVVPAPTGIPSLDLGGPLDFLPSMAGLQGSYYAIYEMAALVVLWVTPGR